MKNKKAFILSILGVLTIIALIAGATFAYFSAQGGESKSANINVSTATTDVLTFTTGSAINIIADQTSFANGKDSLLGQTFAKATLTANNSTNEATENYYVYLNIENNTFKYTLGESSPELLLTVTDPSGAEVTSINGLEYKTATDNKGVSISGFDVTTSSGIIALVNNDEITAGTSSSVGKASNEESWNIKLTFVNYGDDQTANAGAALSAKIMIQKEKIVYHESCSGNTLACHIAKKYTGVQGENGLYYHDSSLTNGAGDSSYRYAGASSSVNNYVCFGSTESTCPTDNLYRIIGVFGDQVKLIKSTVATSALLGTDGDYYSDTAYYWNYKNDTSINSGYGSNTWSTSLLNKTNLNTNFINNIGSEWANKIITTTWKVGGNTWNNIAEQVPSVAYQNEIVNPVTTNTTDNKTKYSAKIGLMYVSDYGFAASPSAWTLKMTSYNNSTASNWLFLGSNEWTISRVAGGSNFVFYVYSSGSVNDSGVRGGHAVRPVFYLESSATYSSGDGASDNPIRLG